MGELFQGPERSDQLSISFGDIKIQQPRPKPMLFFPVQNHRVVLVHVLILGGQPDLAPEQNMISFSRHILLVHC